MIAELVDTGTLPIESVIGDGPLQLFDATLAGTTLEERPQKWIGDGFDKVIRIVPKSWISETSTSAAAETFRKILGDGFLCLFEHSEFSAHDWERLNEVRSSIVTMRDSVESEFFRQEKIDCVNLRSAPASRYSVIDAKNNLGDLLIGGNCFQNRLGPKLWVSLSPAFARSLGLRPHPEIPFSWINQSGETIARTVYWRDGPGRRSPPQFDDVFSRGCIVVIRRSALHGRHDHETWLVHRFTRRSAESSRDEDAKTPKVARSTERFRVA